MREKNVLEQRRSKRELYLADVTKLQDKRLSEYESKYLVTVPDSVSSGHGSPTTKLHSIQESIKPPNSSYKESKHIKSI